MTSESVVDSTAKSEKRTSQIRALTAIVSLGIAATGAAIEWGLGFGLVGFGSALYLSELVRYLRR